MVGPRGLEFDVKHVDDGFDAGEAKQAARKDSQPTKDDDDDEAKDMDEDMAEDGSAEENHKSGGTAGDSNASAKDDHDEDEDDDGNDSCFIVETVNSESDDEDYHADTEDDDETSKKPTKKRTAGKKRTADYDETSKSPQKKRTGGKKRAAELAEKSPAIKKRKADGGNCSPAKARKTGDKPITSRQLFDSINRKKLKACRGTMELLQHMSLPIKRSDEYVAPEDSDDELQSIVDQQGWPWMIHSLSCYTQLKPNDDGAKAGDFLNTPECHIWAGSEAAAEHLRVSFAPVKAFKIIVHTSFDAYFDALRSESAKSKMPPPCPKRDPNAPKKKRRYAKKWRKEE